MLVSSFVSSFVNIGLLAQSRPSAQALAAMAVGHWPRAGLVPVCDCCWYCDDWPPGGGCALFSGCTCVFCSSTLNI